VKSIDEALALILEGIAPLDVVRVPLAEAAGRADLTCSIGEAHGRRIRLPYRLAPDPLALAQHRETVFLG